MYKLVYISSENYADAKGNTRTVTHKELFWVRMCDVRVGLRIKNMSDVVRKEIHGIFETKNPTKDQIEKSKRKRIG